MQTVVAASIAPRPLSTPPDSLVAARILQLKPAEVEKLTGKKLSFADRLKWKLLQKTLKKSIQEDEQLTEKQRRQGRWSMILGLVSIPLLFVPGLGLLAIPAAIVGLVLGIKSVKGNSHANGIIGIIASSLTLFILLLAIAVLAIILSSWQ